MLTDAYASARGLRMLAKAGIHMAESRVLTTTKQIEALVRAVADGRARVGWHATGGVPGLALQVRGNGRAAWVLRYRQNGRAKVLGLGPWPAVGLAEARKRAVDARVRVEQGETPPPRRKPKPEPAKPERVPTFAEAAKEMLAAREGEWRNPKHRAQWRTTLLRDAAALGPMPVDTVDTEAVRGVLEPLWKRVPETASRLRGRVEAVLDYAKVREWRSGDNPARWRGHLAHLLPRRDKAQRVRHHPALPWRAAGAFWQALAARGAAADALRFAILTAARSGEVRGMRWGEIDRDRRVWTIPAERTKARREHVVPLSDPALALLAGRGQGEPEDLVFPAPRGGVLCDMALTALLRRLDWRDARGEVITAPGFRSTFRDWAAETGVDHAVAEACLAHVVSDQVIAAYRRTNFLEQRRAVMAQWAEVVTGGG